ncbi:MAG: hypothetical protein DMD60_12275 [Gemmatimonadetes bacterium]|nr:MAG: hypothetical protein DMD60_12275 [Gemmatimonadota bacterium]
MVVELDTCGSPAKIEMRSAESGVRKGDERVPVTIDAVRETWRIDDEWWREPITRMYYEVLLQDGARLVLFVDLVKQEWFLQKP